MKSMQCFVLVPMCAVFCARNMNNSSDSANIWGDFC